MTMRELVILGSSSQQPTRSRNHGAYLLRWNTEGILLDPGEGTQRQFIFANVAPTCVHRILISHMHGDHCLGLGSMLMRLNLDKVPHPVHCYYPATGKEYFQRLRRGTIYHENIEVIEHPIEKPGIFEETDSFTIEAFPLSHGVDCFGYRFKEKERRKFDKQKLDAQKIFGPAIRELQTEGFLMIEGKKIALDQVSWLASGKIFSYVSDTRYCPEAVLCAKDADLLLCESTYIEEHKLLAKKYAHLTAKQAALIAQQAHAKKLVLTHFSARYSSTKNHLQEAIEEFSNTFAAEDLDVYTF